MRGYENYDYVFIFDDIFYGKYRNSDYKFEFIWVVMSVFDLCLDIFIYGDIYEFYLIFCVILIWMFYFVGYVERKFIFYIDLIFYENFVVSIVEWN